MFSLDQPFSRARFDRLDVALGGVRRGVVPLVAVLAERDPHARRVADVVVLDDPALAPVRADQADLLGGGRRPGRGGVHHREAAHGDVVDARLVRVEHRPADVDLDLGLVGIDALELRPDRGVRRVHLGKPQLRRPTDSDWGPLNTRQSVLTPLTGLIFALNEDHDCQPPVFGTAQVPRSSPSGVSRRISMIPPSVTDAARISICSVPRAEVDSLIADPVAVLDPADALAAFGASRRLNALLSRETRRRDSRRRSEPSPGRSQATFSRYWSALGVPRRGVPDGLQHVVQLGRLDEPVAVQIDRPGVVIPSPGIEPVAANQVAVRIEVAEEAVGNGDLPRVVLHLLPALDDFGALDDDLLAGGGLVDDAFLIGFVRRAAG